MRTGILFLMLLTCGVAQADITSNLIYHWKFDNDLTEEVSSNTITETAGTVAFSSAALPFSGPGTTHNAVFEAADVADSDSNCTGITGAWTYAFWLKGVSAAPRTFMNHYDATSANNGIAFRSIDLNEMLVACNDSASGIQGGTNFRDGNWHHLVVTYDGTNSSGLTLYQNGSSIATGTGTGAVNNADGTMRFNVIQTAAFEIDDLRIYNRELSSDDVSELYNFTGGNPLLLQLQCGQ